VRLNSFTPRIINKIPVFDYLCGLDVTRSIVMTTQLFRHENYKQVDFLISYILVIYLTISLNVNCISSVGGALICI